MERGQDAAASPPAGVFTRAERVLLAAGALTFVVVTGGLTLASEYETAAREHRLLVDNLTTRMSRRLAEVEALLTSFAGYYKATGEVAPERFPGIAAEYLRRYPQVAWIAYAPMVPDPGRAKFEARMRGDGFVDYAIRPFRGAAPDPDTRRTSPGAMPVQHLEPLEPLTARFLGRDVLSRPAWRRVVRESIASGETRAASARGLDGRGRGWLVARATYFGLVDPESAAERGQHASGAFLAFVDPAALLASLGRAFPELTMELREPGRQVPDGAAPAPSVFHLATGWTPEIRYSRSVRLADRPLVVDVARPIDTGRFGLLNVVLAMLLASMFATSVIYGLRVQRMIQRSQREAYAQAQLAQVTLHSIGDAVVRVDAADRVQYLNPVAEAMTGWRGCDAGGRAFSDVIRLGRIERPDERLAPSDLARGEDVAPLLLEREGDSPRAVDCTVSGLLDDAGAMIGRVVALRDVTREHELSTELAHQATHDPLTDLANRREFERRLARALRNARSTGATHAFCYVDLDQFKIVNDTCGHVAGDQMLRQIASLLAGEIREVDLLARLGGDEFGLLLMDCSTERAVSMAERVCRVVRNFRFVWENKAFELGASIGVVPLRPDGPTLSEIQRAADLACYAAKDMGRNRVHLYQKSDEVIVRQHRQMQWHAEIRAALEEDRFVLWWQRIKPLRADAAPREVHEFLLRMVGRDGGLVAPMAFIPAAERYGLMPTIDRLVVERAFREASALPADSRLCMVNLSGQSLSDDSLADHILAEQHRWDVDASCICFEVTETAAISNLAKAVQFMQRLRAEGFRFALDDFGAGLSSFGYLKHLPVDFVKIDGQFVRDIETDPVARAMVGSIIDVSRVLGLKTIAEMVESAAAMDCLRAAGVDYVQGWYAEPPCEPRVEPIALSA